MFQADELSRFYSSLRVNGFAVGLTEQQRVLDLLLQLELTGRIPDNSNQLSNMLGAVLCCNAAQQALFRRQFVNHFGTWQGRRPLGGDAGPAQEHDIVPVPAPRPPEPERKPTVLTREVLLRAGIIACLLLLVLFVIPPLAGWVGHIPLRPPIPAPSAASPAASPFLQSLREWLAQALQGPQTIIAAMQTTFGPATLLLVYVIFIAVGLWVVAPSRPFAAYLSRRRINYRPQLVQLLIRPLDFNPFLDKVLLKRAQDLRRPRPTESREVDVEASLQATLANGGLFTPVFAYRRIAPEYLVLVDRQGGDDHAAHYAETFVSALRQLQVFADVFYYNGDFRRLFSSIGAPASTFEEEAGRHPDHRLIVIGTGDRFFDLTTGNLHPWAKQIMRFDRRVMLTLTPSNVWSYRERALQDELQTPVLPFDSHSISAMIDILVAEKPTSLPPLKPRKDMRSAAMETLAGLLDDRPIRWLEDGTPEEADFKSLRESLRQALFAEEFDWFSACAVYPELKWNLTVHMGLALRASQLRAHGATERLMYLCSLPWFRAARMPTWLRQWLVAEMPAAFYRRVRGILDTLLLTTFAPPSRRVAIEFGLTPPSLDHTMQDRLAEEMHDPVLIDFMTRARTDRTVLKLPAAITRFFSQEGWFRNILSTEAIEQTRSNAQFVAKRVESAALDAVTVRPPEDTASLGPEMRLISEFRGPGGMRIDTPDEYYLYFPLNDARARLLDSVTALIYRRRRDLARRLSIWNVVIVLAITTVLYSGIFAPNTLFNDINSGVAVVTAIILIVSPFAILRFLLVRPIVSCFAGFPAYHAVGNAPRYEAVAFIHLSGEAKDASTSAPANRRQAAAEKLSLADLLRYVTVPLILILVAHHAIVNAFDLNTAYLWTACAAVPFVFGFFFFWARKGSVRIALIYALALGVVGTAGMTVSESLSSGDPILPQTRFDWMAELQFAGIIAFAFVAGHVLARAASALLSWKVRAG